MRISTLSTCLSTAAITLSVFIFTAACHKNKNNVEDTGYASDHAVSEQTFDDIQTIADQSASTTGNLGFRTTATTAGGCATVTHAPGIVTIDFGTADCTCHDGRKRRGKILVTYTGAYADSGSTHTITFDNFYQNDNKITGTKTVTNMGHNSLGQPFFNVHVDGAVTLSGGGTITSVSDRTRTWTKGYTTIGDLTDDVYEITGSGTLTRANGSVITIKVTVPLVVALSCHWIEAGSVNCAIATGQSRTLNYGDTPNCDDMATVTLSNGKTKEIILP
jgi:hypothetical protein